jgi:hypothetical protein
MTCLFRAQVEARAPYVVVKYVTLSPVTCNIITELMAAPHAYCDLQIRYYELQGKHTPGEAYTRNRTSIATQRISKVALWTIGCDFRMVRVDGL